MIDFNKIIKHIKESFIYLVIITALFHIGYVLLKVINTLMGYLLKLIGIKAKVIKYPEQEEEDDVLGI